MNLFDNKKILKRYRFISFGFLLIGVYILVKALLTMTVHKDQWIALSESLQKDSVVSMPTRGNILSNDGDVLASTLPKYKALASASLLTEKCRQSRVLELLKENNDTLLSIPDRPPYIIETEE